MNEKKKEKKGISLIVLVITIIIMIILASAVIISLNGSNIIERAHEAVDRFNEGTEKEKIQTIILSGYKNNELTEEGIKEAVDREFRANTSKVKLFNDGSITIYVESSKREYYIDNKGNITIANIENVTDTAGLSGEGTEANPYKINSIEDLVDFSTNIDTYRTKYIELSRDLDFRSFASYREDNKELMDSLTSGEGFNPIQEFAGTFDGKNNTIANLYMNRDESRVALFRSLVNNRLKIKELKLIGKITGKSSVASVYSGVGTSELQNINSYVDVKSTEGSACGMALGGKKSTYDYCFNYGEVNGKTLAFGISGSGGIINRCNNYGEVNGKTSAVGISGYGSTIIRCSNYGKITGKDAVAGIATSECKISDCINFGNIVGENYVGGISARSANAGQIYCCFNKGNITGLNYVGGIEGESYRYGIIESAYNTGKVIGENYVGGILGYGTTWSSNNFNNCYNVGEVEGTSNVGSIIGYLEGRITVLIITI